MNAADIDKRHFRDVLGHLPTGVVIVTSVTPDRRPVGLTVGSFTSVSLDPPLVAFMPDRGSSTFPMIRDSGHFCANVLSAQQEGICRAFAMSGGNKFEHVPWTPSSESGSPIVDGVVAWVDCSLESAYEAGDHYIVLGRVLDLAVHTPTVPLLFFQGGYGGFAPTTLAMGASSGMLERLQMTDRAREAMDALATETGVECHAQVRDGDHIVVVSSAYPRHIVGPLTKVGVRFPFVRPWSDAFMAWSEPETQRDWLDRSARGSAPDLPADAHRLEAIKSAGWAIGLRSQLDPDIDAVVDRILKYGPTPAAERELSELIGSAAVAGDPTQLGHYPAGAVRSLSAPVLDKDGQLLFMIALHDVPREHDNDQIARDVAALVCATTEISHRLQAAD